MKFIHGSLSYRHGSELRESLMRYSYNQLKF